MFSHLYPATILACLTLQAPAPVTSPEQQVRAAEAAQVKAVLTENRAALEKLWSPHLVVNNPMNTIVTRDLVFSLMQRGVLKYTAYEQTIESVTTYNGTVVVMGQEMTRPVLGPNAGKTEQRRFTDIWQLSGDTWVEVARQATNISVT